MNVDVKLKTSESLPATSMTSIGEIGIITAKPCNWNCDVGLPIIRVGDMFWFPKNGTHSYVGSSKIEELHYRKLLPGESITFEGV